MSDKGLINAGRKVLEARGQPNAMDTSDRETHGTEGSNASGTLRGGGRGEQSGSSGDHPHAHAMRAHAAAMAAHSDYMSEGKGGSAEGEVRSAVEGQLHEHEAGQGDVQSLHPQPGSGVGEQRQAFSGARKQGQLGHMNSVPLP